jgi:prepilin-type N-terminal cleavage/methylation domain-containing protein/prepilin-type processing-associated H-X9-DG protein
MRNANMRPRAGVSLLEVLVCLSLIGILVGLLLPAVQSARGAAERAACQNNLRQIGVAVQNYHATHGRVPPAGGLRPPGQPWTADVLLGWTAHILPQIDRATMWEQAVEACRVEQEPYRPPHVGYVTPIPLYRCPSDGRIVGPVVSPKGRSLAVMSYIGSAGTLKGARPASPGMLDNIPGARLSDVTDGTSYTMLAGERPPPDTFQAGTWYQRAVVLDRFGGPDVVFIYMGGCELGDPCGGGAPYGPGRTDNPCDRQHFWSLHRGGANFVLADGSVRFLPYSAREIISPLMSRAAGDSPVLP